MIRFIPAPFPVAARRTGRADFPHPALSGIMPSPTEGRASARTGARGATTRWALVGMAASPPDARRVSPTQPPAGPTRSGTALVRRRLPCSRGAAASSSMYARLPPSLSHVVPCAASRPLSALSDSFVNRLSLAPASTVPRPGVLPSAGITRPHQYYDPIRHPKGPVPCLAAPPLASAAAPATPRGFPCCTRSLCAHAVATTPAEPSGAPVVRLPRRRRPSPYLSRVGFRIALFVDCSAFTARYGLCAR